jgi:predicted nucleic-acid-binding Zn-ribbon protein
MKAPAQCPKCAGSLELGFILDATHGGGTVARWIAGAPEKSFWTGIKLGGQTQHDIQSFRCTNCGYLESYAIK